jgi:hypothetical protein
MSTMVKIFYYQNQASAAPRWPPLRQTFLGAGKVFGDRYHYVLEEPAQADYLLALAESGIPQLKTDIPRERRVLALMENPSIWTPPAHYLDFFGVVLTPTSFTHPAHMRLVITQPAVSWFYGLPFRTDRGLGHEPVLDSYLELNDLAEMEVPAKTKPLSCIVSNKNGTPGHKWRIETAQALKAHFGEAIDMFGFGWNPIADKREAIDPYHYTVAIENECRDNYWTEKLSDVVLGYGTPIYAGAPNVNQYFQAPVLTLPYGLAPTAFAQQTAALMERPTEPAALHSRRQQVLYQYNLFYHLARLIDASLL